jgi:hypothetical protein
VLGCGRVGGLGRRRWARPENGHDELGRRSRTRPENGGTDFLDPGRPSPAQISGFLGSSADLLVLQGSREAERIARIVIKN